LRLSLVLDSAAVPAWVAEVIRRLRRNPLVSIENFSIVDANAALSPQPLLYRLYLEWDERRNRSKFNPLSRVDLSSELAGVPQVSPDEVQADAAIWLSSSPARVLAGQRLTRGVLRFVPSDPRRRTCGPPYYWELFHHEPVSGSAWELMPANGEQPSVVAEAYSATEIGWSLRQNQAVPYAKAPALLERSLYQLSGATATSALDDGPQQETSSSRSGNPATPAKSLRLGSFIGKNLRRSIQRRAAYRGKEPFWFVAYRSDPKLFVNRSEVFHRDGFQVIQAPEGSFFADPFVISHAGKSYIFLEDFPYREAKGVISVLEVGSDGQIGKPRRVLERPYHLSYPFVFEHGDSVYMIPETLGSRRIELYKATAFPSGWDLVHIFKEDIDAVDTTLWIQDGTYYFFTNIAEPGTTPNDLLYLYLADSLTGEWRSHPANPICADVRSSRSAGSLFLRGKSLIRPAQDCSVRYGYACQLNEIETLSPTEYRERPAGRIEPDWHPGLIGTHTVNSNETIEVIDGQIYKSRYE
jgi:hypothetical protein